MDTGSVDVKDEGEADPTEAEEQDMGSCILCQEQLTRDTSFGCLGLIAANRTLRTTPRGDLAAFKDVLDVPLSLDRASAAAGGGYVGKVASGLINDSDASCPGDSAWGHHNLKGDGSIHS